MGIGLIWIYEGVGAWYFEALAAGAVGVAAVSLLSTETCVVKWVMLAECVGV